MTSRARQITQAAGLVMAAYVASRLLGLVREMVIAQQFGTSADLAAYLAAFRVPDLIFQLLAGGALGSSLIPVFAVFLAQGHEEEGWKLASAVYNLVYLAMTACAFLAFVFAPQLTALLVPGFTLEMREVTAHLMRLMLLTPILFGLSGISMAILNTYQHFLLPALAPLFYNLAIILAAHWLAPTWGVEGLAVGVVIGALLHLLVQLPELIRRGLTYYPTLGLEMSGVREVITLLLPRVAGLAVMQVNFLVNIILASGMAEESLSALNYAFMLMMLPQGVFAMAIATAAFPTFSDLVARQDLGELRRTLSGTLRAILFLTVPASVGLFVLRLPLIEVLLERGEFTASSTAAVAWALQFYTLGLPAYAAVEIVSRAFYALHDTRTPVLVGAATVALNVLLSLLLLRPLRHGGLALANAVAVNIEIVALLWFMRRRLGSVDAGALLTSVGRSALAAALMGGTLWALMRWLSAASPWLVAAGGIGLGSAIYLGAAYLLRASEMAVLTEGFRRRLSRAAK